MPEANESLVELEHENAVEVTLEDEETTSSVIEESATEESVTEDFSEDITEEELATYSTGVRKRIDKLTAKYREAERREQAALQYAKGVIAEKDQLTKTAQAWSDNATQQYAGRITTDLESAKKRYIDAYESGDPEELVAATTDLSKLTVENASLNNEMTALRPSQPVVQQPPAAVQTAVQTAVPPPDPKSQAWASKNEWFGVDEPMTYTAFSIHTNLLGAGFNPESDSYYSEIDRRIREEFPHKFEGTQSTTNGRNSPVQRVASAGRATKSTGRGTVKLTPSQVAIAKKLGVPLEDYARQVREINANA